MTKDNITNVKARHGANLSQNDSNLSVSVQNLSLNDKNLSLIRQSTQIITRSKKATQNGNIKRDVTGAFTHFFIKQVIATDDSKRYYSFTTKLLAVKPSRHTLAIFVPRICLTTNQQINKGMNRNTSVFIQARHIFSVTSANIYDGLIEPNTKAFMVNKLNRLVTVVKTRHPFFMGGNKLTKLLGVIHHG